MKETIYDLAIIGGGPAGMSAGIYAGRYRLKTVLLTKDIGGTCNTAHTVENYPGFKSISGAELMKKFKDHLDDYDVEVKLEEVQGIIKEQGKYILISKKGKYKAKSVILALGTQRRKLNIPGEREFLGKGVSYCATCDARFFRNKIVGVVGGSDTAVTSALLLSEYASRVYIIYRKERLRAEPIWVEKLEKNPKIQTIFQTNVLKILGNNLVTKIKLDKAYQGSKELRLDGLFIEIGAYPAVGLAKILGVKLNKADLVIIDDACQTNVEGIYAAGDVVAGFGNLKQIITAAASGAIAVTSAYKWLLTKKRKVKS